MPTRIELVIATVIDYRVCFDKQMKYECCREEAQEYIDIGALNGLFVLGRSIGFIGESNLDNICFELSLLSSNTNNVLV